jgi:hypothetical protein
VAHTVAKGARLRRCTSSRFQSFLFLKRKFETQMSTGNEQCLLLATWLEGRMALRVIPTRQTDATLPTKKSDSPSTHCIMVRNISTSFTRSHPLWSSVRRKSEQNYMRQAACGCSIPTHRSNSSRGRAAAPAGLSKSVRNKGGGRREQHRRKRLGQPQSRGDGNQSITLLA